MLSFKAGILRSRVVAAVGIAMTSSVAVAASAQSAVAAPSDGPTFEVGLYIYRKIDNSQGAGWLNGRRQTFQTLKRATTRAGNTWFTTFPIALPAHVCGDGWAYQQDKVKYFGFFRWPKHVGYGINYIGWPPLYEAKHGDLSDLITVPDCGRPMPTPTTTETILETFESPTESVRSAWRAKTT